MHSKTAEFAASLGLTLTQPQLEQLEQYAGLV